MDEVLEKAQAYVLSKRGNDVLYGYEHAEKVRMNALYLSEILGGNIHIVQLAALLHDVAFDGKNLTSHAIDSANEAKVFLRSVNYPEEETNRVMVIIKKHDSRSWRDDYKPDTLEEKIVADAENVERLSPLGLLRHAVTCKNMGYTNKELIRSISSFVEKNKGRMFFDESKSKAEFDKSLIEQFLKRTLEQSKL